MGKLSQFFLSRDHIRLQCYGTAAARRHWARQQSVKYKYSDLIVIILSGTYVVYSLVGMGFRLFGNFDNNIDIIISGLFKYYCEAQGKFQDWQG